MCWIDFRAPKEGSIVEIRIGTPIEIEAHGNFLKGVVRKKEEGELEVEVISPKKFQGTPLQIDEEDVIFPNDDDETEEEKPLPKVILPKINSAPKTTRKPATELEILMQH